VKQKDIALIIVIVFISAVVSLIGSRWIFSAPQNRQQTAEVVDVIGPEFTSLPRKYFNVNSVNPTQQIEIGGSGSGNPNPFNAKQQ
jgi:flagellar basal body-associated protein FliL